jgi:hypothetical protein
LREKTKDPINVRVKLSFVNFANFANSQAHKIDLIDYKTMRNPCCDISDRTELILHRPTDHPALGVALTVKIKARLTLGKLFHSYASLKEGSKRI